MEEVGDKVAVAIAPDSWSPTESLTPEQYTVAAISEIWSDEGFIRIDGQARPGHRLRFVVSVCLWECFPACFLPAPQNPSCVLRRACLVT